MRKQERKQRHGKKKRFVLEMASSTRDGMVKTPKK